MAAFARRGKKPARVWLIDGKLSGHIMSAVRYPDLEIAVDTAKCQDCGQGLGFVVPAVDGLAWKRPEDFHLRDGVWRLTARAAKRPKDGFWSIPTRSAQREQAFYPLPLQIKCDQCGLVQTLDPGRLLSEGAAEYWRPWVRRR